MVLKGDMRRVLSAILIFAAAQCAHGAATWWNRDYAARRAVTVYAPEVSLPGDNAAVVTFYTGGHLKKDGADIRVVARVREVPHMLFGVGPGDTATLAFAVEDGVRDYHIYFGNEKAESVDYKWEPQRGLILETREYKGGNPRNIEAMREIWQESGPFYGAGSVDRIWHGQNMYGPSEKFTSLYTGWFMARVPGRYEFATSSDDASFLLVDGEVVVSWPGRHGPVADARHKGAVTLKAGVHKLQYAHASDGGSTCAVAAWLPPGGNAFEVIPEGVFTPLSRAVTGALEVAGERVSADFTTEIAGEALLVTDEELYAVKMTFTSTTSGIPTNLVYWDFGDGNYGRGASATHIYLAEGVYPVRMRLGTESNAPEVTQRVHVHQHWGRQTSVEINDIATYASTISRYEVEKLDRGSLVNMLRFAREQGTYDFIKRAALALVSCREATAGDVSFASATLMEAAGAKRLSADAAVLSALGAAYKAAGDDASRTAPAASLAEIFLERGEAGKAEEVALSALAGVKDDLSKRRLFIAAGDAARYQGDAEKALNALTAAEEIPLGRTGIQETALGGAMAFAAEDYIRRYDYKKALEEIDRWDWEKPLEKLEGYSSYLRAQAYHGQGRDARALGELGAIVSVSPGSAYAPRALIMSARILQSAGNREAARGAVGKIVSEYQTSQEVREARQMLLELGGK